MSDGVVDGAMVAEAVHVALAVGVGNGVVVVVGVGVIDGVKVTDDVGDAVQVAGVVSSTMTVPVMDGNCDEV